MLDVMMQKFEEELEEACRKANDDSQSFRLGYVTAALRQEIRDKRMLQNDLEELRELHKQASTK
jgi:hypothetical protein